MLCIQELRKGDLRLKHQLFAPLPGGGAWVSPGEECLHPKRDPGREEDADPAGSVGPQGLHFPRVPR